MQDEIQELGKFQPPPAFVQASLRRQEKLKEKQDRRQEEAGTTILIEKRTERIAISSTVKRQNVATKPTGDAPLPQPRRSIGKLKTTPSKTALKIEELRLAREERRNKQAETKKAKEGLDDHQQILFAYSKQIENFRRELAAKAKKQSQSAVSQNGKEDDERDIRIRVCVRKRPMRRDELENGCLDIATPSPIASKTTSGRTGPQTLFIHEPKTRLDLTRDIDTHAFKFDRVFGESSSNEDIYLAVGRPLVKALFKGGRATFFAYGQTGSGKTHTVFGQNGGRKSEGRLQVTGLYELACRDIFSRLPGTGLTIHACFFEIYGGRVYDLFGGRERCTLLEDRAGHARIRGLQEIRVKKLEDLMNLIAQGNAARTTASTEANATSSRSHAVFQLSLRQPPDPSSSSNLGPPFGKFSLIDLAGSERGADTGNASRQARIEASDINVSLLALKECIRALHKRTKSSGSDEGSQHVPFRASKLTQVLRDSLVGKGARTVMIANIAPVDSSSEHTLNTLRYAARVKDFHVSSTRKGDPDDVVHLSKGERDTNTERSRSGEDAKRYGNVEFDRHTEDEDDDDDTYEEEPSAGFDTTFEEDDPEATELDEYEYDIEPTRLPVETGSRPNSGSTDNDEDYNYTFSSKDDYNLTIPDPSAEDIDLAVLHSRLGSPTHMSSLHFAVDHLLAAEDALLREHKAALEALSDMARDLDVPLIEAAGKGQGEIDGYATGLAELVDRKIGILFRLRKRIEEVRQRLQEEEEASIGAIEDEEYDS